MKKLISKATKYYRKASIILFILGLVLTIYMIAMEGEPGAFPLALMFLGVIWFTIIQIRIKQRRRAD